MVPTVVDPADQQPDWEADPLINPSPYLSSGDNFTFLVDTSIDLSDDTLPDDLPESIFRSERYNTHLAPDNMQWDFPVPNGAYRIRLFFAETWSGAQSPNIRLFDVTLEGELVLDDYDVYAAAENTPDKAVMESFDISVHDQTVAIDFSQVQQLPALKGIEVFKTDGSELIVDFQASPLEGPSPLHVHFTNLSSGAGNFLWHFGDGMTSPLTSPDHIFTEAGVYTVNLQADNDQTDTISQATTITVTTGLTVSLPYHENFDAYTVGSDPSGWLDTAPNNSMTADDSLFKIYHLDGDTVLGTSSNQTNIHSHYLPDLDLDQAL